MLSKKELEEILYIALAGGGDFAEIFIERIETSKILCEDNKIDKIIDGVDIGAGIRIIKGLEQFYVCTQDLSFESLKSAARSISLSTPEKGRALKVDLKPTVSFMPYPVKIKPDTVSTEKKAELVKRANDQARSFGQRIKQVSVIYSDSNQAVTIANSEGLYVEDNRIRTRFFINVIAEKDNVLQTSFEGIGESRGFEIFEENSVEILANRAADRALKMLDAPHAPTGKMPVIISYEAGGTMIHEACGHALEADFISKKTSIFADKLGQKVANDIITVIDDASIPGNFGSFRFDDEGTPSQKTILIENGVLKGFMTDKLNAKILGINPTGNGRRETFRQKPTPRMTNTFILPGYMNDEEIISSVKDGIFVKKMGGGEVNVTNGDFVFEVQEGYLIENYKIKYPIRGALLIGNSEEVLKSIDMVGNKIEFKPGICGKYDHAPVSDGQPTIRIPQLVIGGR